jgi:MoaA/NifB/PqqE/SkfB family radical SAM enzyme
MKNLNLSQRYKELFGDSSFYIEDSPFPRNIMIDLASGCNHKCVFCRNPRMTNDKRIIDDSLAKKVIAEGYQVGAREIEFSMRGRGLRQ